MDLERRREQNRLAQRRFRQRHQNNNAPRTQMPEPSIEVPSPPPLPLPSPSIAIASPASTRSSSACDIYGSNLLLDYITSTNMDDINEALSSGMMAEQPFLPMKAPNPPSSLPPYSPQTSLESSISSSGYSSGFSRAVSQSNFGSEGDGRDGGDTGWASPLHIAAQKGHDRIIKVLLQHNADCNIRDGEGRTPLIYASIGGHNDIVPRLLNAGALLSFVDRRHRSAIHWAVVHRRESLLKILLSHSQKQTEEMINAYDTDGQTPLHLAIEEDFEAGVQLLLQFGANINLAARKSSSGP